MGSSTQEIARTPNMALYPHSASHPDHLGRVVPIAEFDNGGRVRVLRILETGELHAERSMSPGVDLIKEFITGPEITNE